ncbi:hypothetical protein MBLNU457_4152t1 [Dothideomycetes sp. NU457]
MAEGLVSSLDHLASDIEDLEEALTPILNNALAASTSKLPLLDKAKLYVLATYAIESLLFSYIKLNGVEAKSHPVFRELARVKQYFDKIKTVESAGIKPNAKLDKDAAGRFVKHALAGNDEYDRKREEAIQREKAGAKRKLEDMTEKVGSHTRFEAMSKKMKADEEAENQDGEDEDASGALTKEERKQRRREEKKAQKSEPTHTKFGDDEASNQTDNNQSATIVSRKQKSHLPPRGHREAFEGLLKGPLPEREEKTGKKKKRKSRGEMRQKAEDERADEMK